MERSEQHNEKPGMHWKSRELQVNTWALLLTVDFPGQ